MQFFYGQNGATDNDVSKPEMGLPVSQPAAPVLVPLECCFFTGSKSVRSITINRYPVHDSEAVIIINSVVLGAAIVPEGD